MNNELSSLINAHTAAIRNRDLAWALGVAAIISIAIALAGLMNGLIILVAYIAFAGALCFRRFRYPPEAINDAAQKFLQQKLSAQYDELSKLRVAQGVAKALPEPLFILDTDGIVTHANPAAEDLVGSNNLQGRHFAAVLRAPEVFETAEAVIANGKAQSVDFVTTGSVERSCRALVASLKETSNDPASARALVFIRDLTGERRVEQMRADFIASASHELRTPIASLLGFIETMRGHAKDDPEAQEKFLTIMQSQAERMQRLVSDLMSLSRIELNEHVPPKGVVDLADTARDVVDSSGPLLEQAGAIVDFTNDTDLPTVIRGERDEIFQAIQNLLDNAIKYGGEPAMIKVRIGRGAAPALNTDGEPGHRAGDSAAQIAARLNVAVDDLVFVQIRDFGPGIDRGDLPRLTERFYRVNVERSLKSGGTGLGLAIVKHIANRHKGGFQIESRIAGGTAFNVFFLAAGQDH